MCIHIHGAVATNCHVLRLGGAKETREETDGLNGERGGDKTTWEEY